MARGKAPRGSLIGGSVGTPAPLGEFAEASFVRLPQPVALFAARAERLRAVAEGHTLAPYLAFLAEVVTI